MTSAARREFTIRHLVKRKFGLENVEDAMIGRESFAGCLVNQIKKVCDSYNRYSFKHIIHKYNISPSWQVRNHAIDQEKF